MGYSNTCIVENMRDRYSKVFFKGALIQKSIEMSLVLSSHLPCLPLAKSLTFNIFFV